MRRKKKVDILLTHGRIIDTLHTEMELPETVF